jgi:hypothetical protein
MFEWYYYEFAGHFQGPYPSREEAIAVGLPMMDPSCNLWIMEARPLEFAYVGADDVIARFIEINADIGTAEEPFGSATVNSEEQKQNLSIALHDVFSSWLAASQTQFTSAKFGVIRKTEQILPPPSL